MCIKRILKQKAFADYFIETGNAYKSTIKAGYSENYAKGNVIKLLENARIKNYIEERKNERNRK
ncbi:terminase small subunit [Paraclostridium bifermentans]|uniref:terminase small subunit n=1 Tax=Paraclostridium bifermentans TaxID=1490 RepID=UPI001784A44D|nr:terminase small subunit [Paraclostridium bifermentans]